MQKYRGGRGRGRFHNNGDRYQKREDSQDDEGVEFNYHDDRRRQGRGGGGGNSKSSMDKRRVSFKTMDRQNNRQNYSEKAIRRMLLEEGDEDMSGNDPSQSNRGHGRGGGLPLRRRGSPIPRRGNFSGNSNWGKRRAKLVAGTSGWYQVVIQHGQQFPKDVLFKRILEHIFPQIFVPHYFNTDGNGCSFFVDEFDTAEKLYRNNRIEMSSGQTLTLKVYSSVPNVIVDSSLKDRIKAAMAKRYNTQTKALDLTRFHADADLTDIFVGLSRVSIMGCAIDVIAENVPEIETLILSENKIFALTHFDTLARKCPNLKNLCLRNNKIGTPNTLDNLKSLPLTELVLAGNPIKDKLAPQQYISEVRKRATKLVILDGEPLPPQIGFDVTPEGVLPQAKNSFLCNVEGTVIVRQFLEQYFMLFDSENRQPLLDAYHEHATFTLTSYSPFDEIPDRGLKPFAFMNRNLLKGNNTRNRRYIKYGRLPVVSYLSEFPPTHHDPQSFGVDLSLFLPQMILLTITGLFREKRKNMSQPLRSFQKCLLIVPSGGGFCIRNEMLHITDVTKDQTMGAFKSPPVTEAPQMQAGQAPVAPVAPLQAMPSTSHGVDDVTKMQMVQALAQKSNMNLDWSRKCLEENNWDFDGAGFVFMEMHKQNKIPPEAFMK